MTVRTCTVDGCEQPLLARGYCATHWARWRRYGTHELPSYPSMCEAESCERPVRSKRARLCEMHYCRKRRTGTLADPKRVSGQCLVDECTAAAAHLVGYCRMHYLRLKKRGDVYFEMRGENHPQWAGTDVTNAGFHRRLRKTRGSATRYSCVDCDGPAAHWSYDHSDPDEKRDPVKGPYSTDIDRYDPRCVPCHKRFDMAYIRECQA